MLDDAALGQQIASALRARDPEEGARLLGKYRIELRAESDEALDRYDATRMLDGRWVTVEMPTLAVCSDAQQLERFTATAQAELALRHKNVLAVLDTGVTDDGRPFAVREALDTEPLLGLLARGEKLSWKRIRSIGLQLCGGVTVVRARGLQPCEISLRSCRRARQSQGIDEVKLVGLAPLALVGRDELDDVAAIVAIIEQLADAGGELASPPELDEIRARASATDPAQRFSEVMELGRALAAIGQGATAWSRAPASAAAGIIETSYNFGRPGRSTTEVVEVSCLSAELLASGGVDEIPAAIVAPHKRRVLPWIALVGAVAASGIFIAVPDAWPHVVERARVGAEQISRELGGLAPTDVAATPVAVTAIAPGARAPGSSVEPAVAPPAPPAIASAVEVATPIQTRSQAVPPAPTGAISAPAARARAKRGRIAEPRVTPPSEPELEAAPITRPAAIIDVAAPEEPTDEAPSPAPDDRTVDPVVDLTVAPGAPAPAVNPFVDAANAPEHAAHVPETPPAASPSEP